MLTSIFMAPHGMQIIPGLEEPYAEGFRPLHEALAQARRQLVADEPESMILLTPSEPWGPAATGSAGRPPVLTGGLPR